MASLLLCCVSFGCGDDACPDGLVCTPADGGSGGSGAGGEGATGGDGAAGGTGGMDGGGGEGGGIPAGCTLTEGMVIGPQCGVFVAAGGTGAGTKDAPAGTIQDAIDNLGQAKAIYVCGGDAIAGNATIAGDISIFGRLDCDEWKYAAANERAKLVGVANGITLSLDGSDGTLQGLAIESPDATGTDNSSIAVLVTDSDVTIDDCEISAGIGAPGAAGAAPPGPVSTPTVANAGNGDSGCNGELTEPGGAFGQLTCDGTSRNGGLGGLGIQAPAGAAGGPGSPTNGTTGTGGKQEDGSVCTNGGPGAVGDDGEPGLGASGSDNGLLNGAVYVGAAGVAGLSAGFPGQGGGGGGGANTCTSGSMGAGPGGGGGGAGGCGGTVVGNGGHGGGGSFAVVSIDSDLTITDSTLTASGGGVGGTGGAGQEGMEGGVEGSQGMGGGACPGGHGGKGGRGGAGGGGRGGPSIGVAYKGPAPIVDEESITTASPAEGGEGATNDPVGKGAAGANAKVQSFD